MDSDNASEFILSKLLYQEKKIISSNWYYSTELRVLNTTIIRGLLFALTNNWKMVMVGSCIIGTLIYIFSYSYMMKSVGKDWSFSIFLMIPLDLYYYKIVLHGLYYIPHIAISFFVLGLIFDIKKSTKNSGIKILVCVIISFIAGLGGIRQITLLYAPLAIVGSVLLICKLIKKNIFKVVENKVIASMFLSAISCLFGYVINSNILSIRYDFKSYSEMTLGTVESYNYFNLVNGVFQFFGYDSEKRVMSVEGIISLLSILFVFLVVFVTVNNIKNINNYTSTEQIMILFIVTTNIINFFIFIFVKDSYARHYLIPCLIFYIPMLTLFFKNQNSISELNKNIMYFSCILVGILIGARQYGQLMQYDNFSNRKGAIEYLEKNNYNFGYATFWNANITTCFSNGNIEVTPVSDLERFNRMEWLTKKDNSMFMESDKYFFLINKIEDLNNSEIPMYLLDVDIVYEDEYFIIFDFDD